jgi:hypothetical protein
MRKRNNFNIHGFLNRMTIHFNMFSTLIENRIYSNLNNTRVVGIKRSKISLWKSNDRSTSISRNQQEKYNNLWQINVYQDMSI